MSTENQNLTSQKKEGEISGEELINAENNEPNAISMQGPNSTVNNETQNQSEDKKDFFETKVLDPRTSTENLFFLYGQDGFKKLKPKEDYWKDSAIKDKFIDTYGSSAKYHFDEMYNNTSKEYSQYKLGNFKKRVSGYELVRDDLSALRSTISLEHTNLEGSVQIGTEWGNPTKDYRENFAKVRLKSIDENGEESYKIVDYTPELLETLEIDDSFSGLAYSDVFKNIDPRKPVGQLYYDVIYDGKVHNELTGKIEDVRTDQIVSRWDLVTGNSLLDDVFKNNKLEADGVLDYAKILVKAPMNMAVNLLDTGLQLGRAFIAGGNSALNLIREEDQALDNNTFYKMLSNVAVKTKSYNTSMSREAMNDGYFGSLEAFLNTTADIGLQVALAGGLGKLGSKLVNVKGLSRAEAVVAKNRAAEIYVRGTLTAMAAKDSYNEALENGFTPGEASLITGAMVAALWKATKHASYLFGDFEAKYIRKSLRDKLVNNEFEMLKKSFPKAALESTKESVKEGVKKGASKKALDAMLATERVVNSVFDKTRRVIASSKWSYAAQQESLEEMTEELFQDGVKHAASAYGYLMNDAKEAGKGRYYSIFDEGYFKHAAERYATAGVAGGFGGMFGNAINGRAELSPISSSSSLADIILAGHRDDLIKELDAMKENGELGPSELSVEYDEALGAFKPILEGTQQESLADMVYNTYLHDINVVDTFLNMGMMGDAKKMVTINPELNDFVSNNSMRKDLAELGGRMLDFHSNKKVSTKIYAELDKLSEMELSKKIPEIITKITGDLEQKKQELKDLKEVASRSKSDAKKDNGESSLSEPETEEKEKNDSIAENNDSEIKRLEAEIELSGKISKEDLLEHLDNYRKVRAIASGKAAENYLLQNEFSSHRILGSKVNRDEEYRHLGDNPIKDMLFAMRTRAVEDEKKHLKTLMVSKEIEQKILDISTVTPESLKEIEDILQVSPEAINEKTLKHLLKLRDSLPFNTVSKLLDVNNKFSIFTKDDNKKTSKEELLRVYKEILTLDPRNRHYINDPKFLKFLEKEDSFEEFFEALPKDINSVSLPVYVREYDDDFDPTSDYKYKKSKAPESSFILLLNSLREDGTLSNTQQQFVSAITSDGFEKLNFLDLTGNIPLRINQEDFFKEDSFSRRNVNALLRNDRNGVLQEETLLERGLAEVSSLIASSSDDIYSMSETSGIDSIMSKIAIKEAFAGAIGNYFKNDISKGNLINMLAQFRKNTLDIIDFKYKPGAVQNTEIETHPYKDYSVMSDFFTDFLFDPLLLKKAMMTAAEARTSEDNNVLKHYNQSLLLLEELYYTEDSSGKISAELGDINWSLLEEFLDTTFNNLVSSQDLEDAVDFFKENDIVLNVPVNVIEGYENIKALKNKKFVNINFVGLTKLKASKWLFKNSRAIMEKVSGKDSKIPYIRHKEKNIERVFEAYDSLIHSQGLEPLKTYLEKSPEFDGYKDFLLPNIVIDHVKMEKINMKIEKLLYDVYNGNIKLNEVNEDNIKSSIDSYLLGLNQDYKTELLQQEVESSSLSRRITSIIGAITTDFEYYYTQYKDVIKNTDKNDPKSRMLIAEQEFVSKYVYAYTSSEDFKNYTEELSAIRKTMGQDGLKALYIAGTAGSGKTSTINSGLDISAKQLKEKGISNYLVLPVSNHDIQVNNLKNSLGDLSEDIDGKDIDGLITLLQTAVEEGDNSESFSTLQKIGTIAIDEVTYVEARNVGSDIKENKLSKINRLIEEFNTLNIKGGKDISLVVIGDPRQSGSQVLLKGSYFSTEINRSLTHFLPYMDFSFRSRNSYSLDAISNLVKSMNSQGSRSPFFHLERPTNYGTSNGKFYGVNLVDESKKEDKDLISKEFAAALNDEELANNIEANIKKNIKELEEAGEEDKVDSFSVIVAPVNLEELTKGDTVVGTRIQELMKVEAYKPYFTVMSSEDIGGSEANYVIAEIPETFRGKVRTIQESKKVHKNINTLITRAFDYSVIINRESGFKIKKTFKSIQKPDGQVIVPNNKKDAVFKGAIKEYYLKILSDVDDIGGDNSDSTSDDSGNSDSKIVVTSKDPDSRAHVSFEHTVESALNSFVADEENGPLNTKAITKKISGLSSLSTNKNHLNSVLNNVSRALSLLNDVYVGDTPFQEVSAGYNMLVFGVKDLDTDLYNKLIELSEYIEKVDNETDLDSNRIFKHVFKSARLILEHSEYLDTFYFEALNSSEYISLDKVVVQIDSFLSDVNNNSYELYELYNELLDIKKERDLLDSPDTREEYDDKNEEYKDAVLNIINFLNSTINLNENYTEVLEPEENASLFIIDLFSILSDQERMINADTLEDNNEDDPDDDSNIDLDIKEDPEFFTATGDIIMHLNTLSIEEIDKLLKSINNDGDKYLSTGELNNILEPFINKYGLDAVHEEMSKIYSKVISDIKARKAIKDKSKEDNKISLNNLKRKIGISNEVQGRISLYKAIQEKDLELLHKISLNKSDDFSEEVNDLLAIKEYWKEVYGAPRGSFQSDDYGKMFYDKFVNRKETLEDYIKRVEEIVGVDEQYTVSIKNSGWINKNKALITHNDSGAPLEILYDKEPLNFLFGFNGESKGVPNITGLEIRAAKIDGRVKLFIIAVSSNKKYVISQIDNNDKKLNDFPELKKFNDKFSGFFNINPKTDKEINLAKKVKTYNGNKYVDVKLSGSLRDLIKARAGRINTAESSNSPGAFITELENKNIKLADVFFVSTEGDSVENRAAGRMFTFYYSDKSTEVDKKDLISKVQEGKILSTGNFITSKGSKVNSQLGLLPVSISNDMRVLSKAIKSVDSIQFGEFPSYLSTVIQSYIIKYLNSFEGVNIDGINSTIKNSITFKFKGAKTGDVFQELTLDKASLNRFVNLDLGLKKYYSSKKLDGVDMEAIVEEKLKLVEKDGSLDFLKAIAQGFIHGELYTNDNSGANYNTHLIAPYKNTGAYSFRINRFLKVASPDILDAMTRLTNVLNYRPKINVEKGTNAYAAVVSSEASKALKSILVSDTISVETPLLTLTSVANSAVDVAIKKASTIDISENLGDDYLKALTITDTILKSKERFSVKGDLFSIGSEQRVSNIKLLEKTAAVLQQDPAYKKDLDKIVLAIDILKSLENSIIDNVEGDNYLDLLPEILQEDQYKPYIKPTLGILSSIISDFNPTNQEEKADIVFTALLSLQNSSIEIDEDMSIDDYLNELIEDIILDADPNKNNGLSETLTKCKL